MLPLFVILLFDINVDTYQMFSIIFTFLSKQWGLHASSFIFYRVKGTKQSKSFISDSVKQREVESLFLFDGQVPGRKWVTLTQDAFSWNKSDNEKKGKM